MVKTGLNGHHLNWEIIDTSHHVFACLDCVNAIEDEKRRLKNMLDDREIDIETYEEQLEEKIYEIEECCTNHTYAFYYEYDEKQGTIFYDSNMNTVALHGYIPYDVLNDDGKEYLKIFHDDDYFFVDDELIYVRGVIR